MGNNTWEKEKKDPDSIISPLLLHGSLLSVSKPQFPHLRNGNDIDAHFVGCHRTLRTQCGFKVGETIEDVAHFYD